MSDKLPTLTEAYQQGWDGGYEQKDHEVRVILADLIAELRTTHYPHTCTDPEDFPCCCQECREHWPCGIEATARSAEARLREATGDASV